MHSKTQQLIQSSQRRLDELRELRARPRLKRPLRPRYLGGYYLVAFGLMNGVVDRAALGIEDDPRPKKATSARRKKKRRA